MAVLRKTDPPLQTLGHDGGVRVQEVLRAPCKRNYQELSEEAEDRDGAGRDIYERFVHQDRVMQAKAGLI